MLTRKLSAYLLVLMLSTAAFAFVSFGTQANQDSEDAFGYYWTDNKSPSPTVSFNWIDATSGTNVGFSYADNTCTGPVPIGFSFGYYGNTYSMLNISCNGFVQFNSASTSSNNYQIPYAYDANNIVAAFFDDLVVYEPVYNYGAVYYDTIGVSPNQQMVVEYYHVSRDGSSNLMTFEIILNETGEIWFQYLSMSGETGNSATVGIENSGGTIGSQYSYNTGTIVNGLAIMFEQKLVAFGPDTTAKAGWGEIAEYDLTITNNQGITDSFNITVDESLLGWPVEILDGYGAPLADNNTGDLAPAEALDIIVRVTVPDPPSTQNETTVLMASSSLSSAVNDTVTLVTRADQAVFYLPFFDYGEDTNLDGDFESLVVAVNISALVGGYVRLDGVLRDSEGDPVDIDSTYVALSAGLATLDLYFDGDEIYEEMLDGPYDISLSLRDADNFEVSTMVYETSAYSYTDFEEPAYAMFFPPHSDYAVDDGDANVLYDRLIVNVSLQVFTAGDYTVEAYVYETGYGIIYFSEASAYIDVGVHELQLLIPGSVLNESDLSGTCTLDMSLFIDSTWLMDAEYETGSYIWSDFEGKPVAFAPPYDDYAFDTDLDGDYNILTITIPIECYETGVYDIDIEVFDGGLFDSVHDTLILEAGTTTDFEIVYDAEKIWTEGLSDYLELDMCLSDNATHLEYDSDILYTAYYYYWNFDEVGGEFSDYDTDDYGHDTDSDGYYNEVVITLYILPHSTGSFLLDITVRDYYGYNFLTFEDVVYLEEGIIESYEVVLDGYDIIVNDIYGYFRLIAYLYNQEGSYQFDYLSYYTSYYYEDSFDPIGAFFEGPHEDAGRDDDNDGLYDCLVFTIYANASSSGYYDLEAVVSYYSYYETVLLEVYLVENTVTAVLLEVDSAWISRNYVSSYWHLDMTLSDHYSSFEYDDDYYTTGDYYYYYEFDPPSVVFYPPHDDYGLDVDSDGYYDYLVIDAYMDCNDAGVYTVTAQLWAGGTRLADMTETTYMSAGSVSVEFAIEGWILEANGFNGYYTVYLEVYDSEGVEQDYDTHYTDYYYYSDFTTPPATFTTPHDHIGLDDDDDGLYEYIVVEVSVEVFVAGDFAVEGVLFDEFENAVDMDRNVTSLETGVQVVELWFAGWVITAGGEDLWYVSLELYDTSAHLMDTDVYSVWGFYDLSALDSVAPSMDAGWAYDSPVIDGTVSEDEWFGAVAANFMDADRWNTIDVMMYVLNNETHLFVLLDVVGDSTPSADDFAVVAFETGNDGIFSNDHEDVFMLSTTGAGTDAAHSVYESGFWVEHCYPFDDDYPGHDGLVGAGGFGPGVEVDSPHRTFELCVPLELLLVSPGETTGLMGIAGGQWSGEEICSAWPTYLDLESTLSPGIYGNLTLSNEPPLTTLTLEGDEGTNEWFLGDVGVTLASSGGTGSIAGTWYRLDGGSWQDYGGEFTVSGDGVHVLQYYSSDTAGNNEPVRSVDIMIDTEAPESSASVTGTLGTGGWFVGPATVAFTFNDSTSGAAFLEYRLDGGDWVNLTDDDDTLLVSDDRNHTLEYRAVDIAGQEEPIHELAVLVDRTAPVTTAIVDGSMVTLSVDDGSNCSGPAVTMYRIDGGEWIEYSGPFKVKGEGNHTIDFYSSDVAGNNETAKSVSVEGATGFTVLGLDWWIALLIGAVVVLILIGILFQMRKRRGPRGPQQMPQQPYMMTMGDNQPAWPDAPQEPPPNAGDGPPPSSEGE